MTTIYIVRKHKRVGMRWHDYEQAYYTAFVIYGAYALRKEAKAEAEKKNAKSRDYVYLVGKVEVK
jgi:hypothetical protein